MLSRDILNALWPDGSFWIPEIDDDYDNLLEGISENSEEVKTFLNDLRYLRDPDKTTILSDLESEYGIIPTATATDSERRERLKARKFQQDRLPTYEVLETKLQEAGFDVQVHANSPAVDPDTFLAQNFQMTAGDLLPGGNDAQAGEPEAYAGVVGGELLVNGETYDEVVSYFVLCGGTLYSGNEVQAGEAEALAGNFDSIKLVPSSDFEVPGAGDSGYWPLIFFVGGDATRNASGEITNIDIANVIIEREMEFKRIILQYKPMFSWAALIVTFT